MSAQPKSAAAHLRAHAAWCRTVAAAEVTEGMKERRRDPAWAKCLSYSAAALERAATHADDCAAALEAEEGRRG